ncbi:MAG: phosphatase PAP2 family protein [Sedimentisphaerales bacterium]|nr:phosphatase PAP2 family protein [Sedimentisphaerales bacterium]
MRPTAQDRAAAPARLRGVWKWLGQNVDLAMILALACVLVGAWVVGELADEVMEGTTQRFDEWAVQHLRSPQDPRQSIGPAWFEAMWTDLTSLGSASVLALVTLACAGYLLMSRHYRTLVVLAAVVGGGVILTFAMKAFFDRPRPEYAAHVPYVVTASFPSGHSMLSAVVYMALAVLLARTSSALRFQVYFISCGLIVTLLVGFSRVYLGVHYPTDVLAGWSAGLTWAALCWLVVYCLQKAGVIERPDTQDGTDAPPEGTG